MGRAFISGNMNIPSQAVVDGFTLPHVLVSDEIFALKTWLMTRSPRKDLRAFLQGGRVTLLGGSPYQKGQNIALLYK